ncbi:hypothetical protein [Streptomyces sp. NPDC042319]|uniref:hypothetical protein n=1 Tax=Streptomyces sp. NPDC042319 TaxID=3154332 RepID=UPI0033F14F12
MHGPAPAPPPPRPLRFGTAVLLRVVLVGVAVLSLGMLAWVALLRAALVHRRPVAWWLFGVDAGLVMPLFAVLGSVPENDWRGDAAMVLILLQMAAAVAYYLAVDIRARARSLAAYPPDHSRTTQPPGAPPYGAPAYGIPAHGAPAYGTPAYGAPAYGTAPFGAPGGPGATAAPNTPAGYAAPATGYAAPGTGYAAPATGHAAPARPQRIEQVRAELDELSDYLRRSDGSPGNGSAGDGRGGREPYEEGRP